MSSKGWLRASAPRPGSHSLPWSNPHSSPSAMSPGEGTGPVPRRHGDHVMPSQGILNTGRVTRVLGRRTQPLGDPGATLPGQKFAGHLAPKCPAGSGLRVTCLVCLSLLLRLRPSHLREEGTAFSRAGHTGSPEPRPPRSHRKDPVPRASWITSKTCCCLNLDAIPLSRKTGENCTDLRSIPTPHLNSAKVLGTLIPRSHLRAKPHLVFHRNKGNQERV